MDLAIERGEFKELPADVVKAKCTQTAEIREKAVSEDGSGDDLMPSSPREHFNKMKVAKRMRTTKLKVSPISRNSQSLDLLSSVISQPVKMGQTASIKSEVIIKEEENYCTQYSPAIVKSEHMEVGEVIPAVMAVTPQTTKINQPPASSTSYTSSASSHPENINIDIENFGNLESIFVMLHKDSEEENDSIDINSFLANL